jgi:hypothetical protein
MPTLLGLLYRLPRVLAMPLALLLVALAGCIVATLACALPMILLCLWARRNVMEWRQRRMLEKALLASGLAALQAQRAKPDATGPISSK